MRSVCWWTMVGVLALAPACRRDRVERAPEAPAPESVDVPLGAGETVWRTPEQRPVTADWRRGQEGPVRLYVARTGPHTAVLRAQTKAGTQDVESFRLRGDGAATVELHPLENDRAVLRYSLADDERKTHPAAAVLLGWDEDKQRVRVLKRWRGAASDAPPAWVRTGDVSLAGEALAGCARVAQKIANCREDRAFRRALFREPALADTEAAFSRESRDWLKADAAERQCRTWAGEEYEASALTEPRSVAELVEDTDLSCELFGRELDDEGGLPRRSGVAAAEREDERDLRRAQGRTPSRVR